MKMIPLIMLLSTFTCNSSQEIALPITTEKLGIGLLHFSPANTIRFYKDENAKSPFDSLVTDVVKSGSHKGRAKFNTSVLGSRLKPYVLSEGDSDAEGESNRNHGLIRFSPEITFGVIKKNGNAYTVVISEQSGETAVVKSDPKHDYHTTKKDKKNNFFDPNFPQTNDPFWFFYETWEEAMKRAWNTGMPENTVYYDQPNGKRITFIPESSGTGVDSVNGDWARFYNKFSDNKTKAWAKWRENDSMKVNLILHGGYE